MHPVPGKPRESVPAGSGPDLGHGLELHKDTAAKQVRVLARVAGVYERGTTT